MDLEELDVEEYYGGLKMMFTSQGWALFQAELLEQAELIGDLQVVTDARDLHYRQGQLATIGTILNFQDTIRRAEEELNESFE